MCSGGTENPIRHSTTSTTTATTTTNFPLLCVDTTALIFAFTLFLKEYDNDAMRFFSKASSTFTLTALLVRHVYGLAGQGLPTTTTTGTGGHSTLMDRRSMWKGLATTATAAAVTLGWMTRQSVVANAAIMEPSSPSSSSSSSMSSADAAPGELHGVYFGVGCVSAVVLWEVCLFHSFLQYSSHLHSIYSCEYPIFIIPLSIDRVEHYFSEKIILHSLSHFHACPFNLISVPLWTHYTTVGISSMNLYKPNEIDWDAKTMN